MPAAIMAAMRLAAAAAAFAAPALAAALPTSFAPILPTTLTPFPTKPPPGMTSITVSAPLPAQLQ
jgi:hypothetical protein